MGRDGNGDGRSIPEQEATVIPQDWVPSAEGVAFARRRGYAEEQIKALGRGYVQRHDQRGDTSTDWDAGFKLWILSALNPTGPAYLPPAEHRPS